MAWQVFLIWGAVLTVAPWLLSGRHATMQVRSSATLAGVVMMSWALKFSRDESQPWITVTALACVAAAAGLGLWRALRMRAVQHVGDRGSGRARLGVALDLGAEGQELVSRFDDDRDAAALNAGIDKLEKALAHSRGTRYHAAVTVSLMVGLVGRYDRLGDRGDLDRAIDIARSTAHLAPDDPYALVMLCRALRLRYLDAGDLRDLRLAVEAGQAALRVARPGQDPHPQALEALSDALFDLSERTGSPTDRDAAMRLREQLTLRAPWRGMSRAAALAALSSWTLRANEGNSLIEIDRAVDYGRRAVRAAAVDRQLRYYARLCLSGALRARYERRRDVADLGEAVRQAERAVRSIAPDDPLGCDGRLALARALANRYERFRQRADLELSLAHALGAADHPAARTPVRVVAGLTRAKIAMDHGEYGTAVHALEAVVALLPRLAGQELIVRDQEHRLGELSGIAATAASCALEADLPEKALRLLEEGRGVLLTRALSTPTDITELRRRHPQLAADLEKADAALKSDGDVSQRRRGHDAYEAVLERIRSKEGFADFGQPPPIGDLLPHAAHGPVVYLISTPDRAHAILLTAQGVRTLTLPEVTAEALVERVITLLDAVAPERVLDLAVQPAVHDVLAWLWDVVAAPVLQSLNLPDAGTDRLPRVWWIPTGPFTFLPIHAAGHHRRSRERPHPETVLDRVVSSYAPTLRALMAARSDTDPGPNADLRPLVVSLPETSGAPDLRNAALEAELVSSLFPAARVLAGEDATYERVQAELVRASLAHFACHGITDADSPSRSALLLHDHGFSVADVSALRRRHVDGGAEQKPSPAPEMAYLSVCDSARSSMHLTDESIHLATAFQLAGFRQVVASLWPLVDDVAYSFAADFYRRLHANHTPGARIDGAAAVHQATHLARTTFPNLPTVWAGHIHVGA